MSLETVRQREVIPHRKVKVQIFSGNNKKA